MLIRLLKYLANLIMRPWYRFINRTDVEGILHFMNYGYHSDSELVTLRDHDEAERYPIQLYHHTATAVELTGRHLLEVGCGRGGGISYIHRYLQPASATGIDLDSGAIAFCSQAYPGISFDVMNAQELRFPDGAFDAVINVESSHRYPDFGRFVREVCRVLRPGGHFLISDFRFSWLVDEAIREIEAAGFTTLRSETINAEVLNSLRRDKDRRTALVRNHLPKVLHGAAMEFAGTPGTRLYRSIETGKRTYFCLALEK